MRRAIERKRQECLPTQFAAKRGGRKLWCQGQLNRELDMREAALDSTKPMPEPRRLDLPLLPAGQDERYYLERFMREFGEAWNGTAIIEAPTGHSLSVSPLLFTDHKTGKTNIDKEGRSAYVLYLAETILSPDEILLHQGGHGDRSLYLLGRYIVKGLIMNVLVAFKNDGAVWTGWTGYQTFDRVYIAGKHKNQLLIYRREEE